MRSRHREGPALGRAEFVAHRLGACAAVAPGRAVPSRAVPSRAVPTRAARRQAAPTRAARRQSGTRRTAPGRPAPGHAVLARVARPRSAAPRAAGSGAARTAARASAPGWRMLHGRPAQSAATGGQRCLLATDDPPKSPPRHQAAATAREWPPLADPGNADLQSLIRGEHQLSHKTGRARLPSGNPLNAGGRAGRRRAGRRSSCRTECASTRQMLAAAPHKAHVPVTPLSLGSGRRRERDGGSSRRCEFG